MNPVFTSTDNQTKAVKKEEIDDDFEKRRPQELTQLTPLMAQNGAAGMIMQHQMYQAGYQMPPSVGYPSAPPTPGMVPSGAAPPPTMMYPGAHPASLMHPGYPGYASGSSTPVNSNARSPARSRKAMGMDNASSWLGQQHPHLGAPGTPGPGSPYGSRAPSVMSYAGMSTMTGFNDDAVSVVSLVELQPATSHQTENIDPARMGATIAEVNELAMRIVQPPDQSIQAMNSLVEVLKRSRPEQFPKDVLEHLIAKTLEALCRIQSLQLDQMRINEMLNKLFSILYTIASISSDTRKLICIIADRFNAFDAVMYISCMSLGVIEPNRRHYVFIRSLGFLIQMLRDEDQSEHSRKIMSVFATNKDLFSLVYRQMINTQYATAIEFVCRLLRKGDRRKFREKITEVKIQMLIEGTAQHPGLLARYMRKRASTEISNTLRIIELLARNDLQQTEHEKEIQKWIITNKIFDLLYECLSMNDHKVLECVLQIFATLAGSPYISDDVAAKIAGLMVCETCLKQTALKLQNFIIFTLSTLSARRVTVQRMLVETDALTYACHLIKNYAKGLNAVDLAKNATIEDALNVCHRQLQLELPPELSQALWTEGTDKSVWTRLFFDPSFVSALLNILVSGTVSELLKTRAVQIMVLGLTLPSARRFSPLLFSVFDEINGQNVVAALYTAVNTSMMSGSPTAAAAAFLRSAADLFVLIVAEPLPAACLANYAKCNSINFPLNILFHPAFENDSIMVTKLLQVCHKLVEEQELQQAWSLYREQFNNLSISGNYEIREIANSIYQRLGVEGDSDYNMLIANSMTN